MMFEAEINEFPFVRELPKREKSKYARVWDTFRELSAIAKTEGMPIPQVYAAKALGICTQRVSQLANEGRLKVVMVGGTRFVTENSVVAYAKSERKAGRPFKMPETPRELLKAGREIVAEARRK